MLDMVINLLKGFVNLLKLPIIILFATYLVIGFLVCINLIILHKKGYRFKKGNHVVVKKKSVIRRLFIDAPHMIAKDMIEHDPEFFKHQGMIIFTGRQGKGKTIGMVEFMRRMQIEFPKSKCITNLNYKYQNDELGHWKEMVNYNNGIQGVIVGMDETQNWFSSNDSKNFPPEMLQEITQNRKQRRIILGTAQCFNRLAKPLREQTTEVRECITLMRCITIIRRREPILDSEGNVQEYKNRGIYFFVHSQELRDSYDTWKTIKKLTEVGFQEKDYIVQNGIVINVSDTGKTSTR